MSTDAGLLLTALPTGSPSVHVVVPLDQVLDIPQVGDIAAARAPADVQAVDAGCQRCCQVVRASDGSPIAGPDYKLCRAAGRPEEAARPPRVAGQCNPRARLLWEIVDCQAPVDSDDTNSSLVDRLRLAADSSYTSQGTDAGAASGH